MKSLFWIIPTFLLFSCSPPKDSLHQDVVDLDSLASEEKPQSDADKTLVEDSAEPQLSSNDLEDSPLAPSPPSNDLESPAVNSLADANMVPPSSSDPPVPLPSTITLIAQTLPVSEPHRGSPGGIIADTLRIFQCNKLDADSQERFFLHVLNYRIHTLGTHPLCEVMQVTDVKKILTYANYQRKHCDEYTSDFIKEKEQYQCTQIINLIPASESEEKPA